jgi:hypothetical protein
MNINSDYVTVWKEAVVDIVHSLGESEEKKGKSRSGETVTRPKFELEPLDYGCRTLRHADLLCFIGNICVEL